MENIWKVLESISKKCSKCGIRKYFEFFCNSPRGKNGLQSFCKICQNKNAKERQKLIKIENIATIDRTLKSNKTKICKQCNIEKNIVNEFAKDIKCKGGFDRLCKDCKNKNCLNKMRIYKELHTADYYNSLKNETKICLKCKIEKSLTSDFWKDIDTRDGFFSVCTKCMSEINKIRYDEKDKHNPAYKLRHLISISIKRSLKYDDGNKYGKSCIVYLPYTVEELKECIEVLFEPWMIWENWGKLNKYWNKNDPKTWTWHLDHIIPQSILPHKSMLEDNFQKCWALNNLRPYCAKKNTEEGNKRTLESIENIKLDIKQKILNSGKTHLFKYFI